MFVKNVCLKRARKQYNFADILYGDKNKYNNSIINKDVRIHHKSGEHWQ